MYDVNTTSHARHLDTSARVHAVGQTPTLKQKANPSKLKKLHQQRANPSKFKKLDRHVGTNLSMAARNDPLADMSVDRDVVNRDPPMSSFTFCFGNGCVPSNADISSSSSSFSARTSSVFCFRVTYPPTHIRTHHTYHIRR